MYPLSYLLGLNKFTNGAWYEPSRQQDIGDCLMLLDLQSSDTAVDIGSGDGRVVAAMAASGARVAGVEQDSKWVERSRAHLHTWGWAERTEIIQADMWEVDYAAYNKVFVYQFKHAMQRLERKLWNELHPGSLVVCNYWPFPTWKPLATRGYAFLYRRE